MGNVAYALREEFTGTVEQVEHEGADPVEVPVYSGGVVKIGFDEDLDVSVALEEGGGLIVIEDSKASAIAALDEYPPLKRVAAPPDAEAIAGYQAQTSQELGDELERRGIRGRANKDDRVAALERLDTHPVRTYDPDDPPTVEAVLAGDYDGAPEEG